jgi:predicted GNAT superfamily acetyltransferase
MARKLKKKGKANPAAERGKAPIVVRHCHGLAEFGACFDVQRAVWGSADADLVPLPLFVVAAETGGQVLGAFAEDRMVGFTLALAGLHGRAPFLHSHMTAVIEGWRDRGIGRSLKVFQREDALARGIDRIEWTFDPLQIKNAYFNLVRLGAVARRFVANMYGSMSSPLQGGLPTDRLVAEWHLGSACARRALAGAPPVKRALRQGDRSRSAARKTARIRVPAELAGLRHSRPEEAMRMQAEIRQEFEYWLNRGYAAVSVTPAGEGGEYLLQPWAKE